jgi:hypothetical protein
MQFFLKFFCTFVKEVIQPQHSPSNLMWILNPILMFHSLTNFDFISNEFE